MNEQIVEVAGRKVHLLRGGRGTPLVFLHGGEGSLQRTATALAQFTDRFDVIAPLHPGFGKSEPSAEIDSVDDLVYHYLDLFDVLGLTTVDLVGLYILGGWVAAEISAAHPHRVNRLVLVDAGGIRVEGVIAPNPFMLPIDQTAARLVSDPEKRGGLTPNGPEQFQSFLKDRDAAARFLFKQLYNPRLKSRLKRVRAATLVVWGKHDPLLPLSHGEAYADAIPGARLSILPAGHAVLLEQPEQFARIVTSFLKEGI